MKTGQLGNEYGFRKKKKKKTALERGVREGLHVGTAWAVASGRRPSPERLAELCSGWGRAGEDLTWAVHSVPWGCPLHARLQGQLLFCVLKIVLWG